MKVFLLVVSLVLAVSSEGISLLYLGLGSNSFNEYRDKLDNDIKTRWGVSQDITFVSERRTEHLRNLLSDNRIVSLSAELFSYIKDYNLEKSVIVVPTIKKYAIKAERTKVVGAKTVAQLTLNLVFYDAENRKEIYAGDISAIKYFCTVSYIPAPIAAMIAAFVFFVSQTRKASGIARRNTK